MKLQQSPTEIIPDPDIDSVNSGTPTIQYGSKSNTYDQASWKPTSYQAQQDQSEQQDQQPERPQVIVFVALNNTSHRETEIPEILEGLKLLNEEHNINRQMIVISDALPDGSIFDNDDSDPIETKLTTLGQFHAARTQWLGGTQQTRNEGKISIDGIPYQLLTTTYDKKNDSYYIDANETFTAAELQTNWFTVLSELGMDTNRASQVASILFSDGITYSNKDASESAYAGGDMELVELIMTLDRAERGEFDITQLVLSSHHYGGDGSLFGAGINDVLNMEHIWKLSAAFPNAYSNVEVLNFSACSTYNIKQPNDDDGKRMNTAEYLRRFFPNLKYVNYWNGTCPDASTGAPELRSLVSEGLIYSETAIATTTGNAPEASINHKTRYDIWKSGHDTEEHDFTYPSSSEKLAKSKTSYHTQTDLAPYLYAASQEVPDLLTTTLYQFLDNEQTAANLGNNMQTQVANEILTNQMGIRVEIKDENGSDYTTYDNVSIRIGTWTSEVQEGNHDETLTFLVQLNQFMTPQQVLGNEPFLVEILGDGDILNTAMWHPRMGLTWAPSVDFNHYNVTMNMIE